MSESRPKKKLPRDANQLAKAIVDMATGDERCEPPESAKAAAGRKGGLKGGKTRQNNLTDAQRSEIAREAAKKRWGKQRDTD